MLTIPRTPIPDTYLDAVDGDSQDCPPPIKVSQPSVLYLDVDRSREMLTGLDAPTPECVNQPRQERLRFELLQLVLANALGKPMSLPHIRDGAVLQDIVPRDKDAQTTNSSHGSSQIFSFHNDMSYLDDALIPDYFTLGCLRNTEQATTLLADPFEAAIQLDGRLQEQLFLPNYILRHTYHRNRQSEYTSEKCSPVFTSDGHINLGVDMQAQTPEAAVALTAFRQKLGELATPCVLQTGEILVVPNQQYVHGRSAFTMHTDPAQRRWLQRVMIQRSS